jgi:benzoate membrane transport protein
MRSTSPRLQRRFAPGRQAHEDPSKRWIAGLFYILVGVFGVTLAAVFMAFPATFITTLAGLALLGAIGGSLASAMADAKSREASLITFLAAAANITLFGIGGAFWGLLIGLMAYAMLNGQLPQRKQAVHQTIQPSLDLAFGKEAKS